MSPGPAPGVPWVPPPPTPFNLTDRQRDPPHALLTLAIAPRVVPIYDETSRTIDAAAHAHDLVNNPVYIQRSRNVNMLISLDYREGYAR